MTGAFYVATDTQVTLKGIKDVQGIYSNTATVTGTLKNLAGTPVTGGGSISFTYVPGSDGNYIGTIPAAAAMIEKQEYDLWILVDTTSTTASFRIRRRAMQLAL
jgi:hypothetical protein